MLMAMMMLMVMIAYLIISQFPSYPLIAYLVSLHQSTSSWPYPHPWPHHPPPHHPHLCSDWKPGFYLLSFTCVHDLLLSSVLINFLFVCLYDIDCIFCIAHMISLIQICDYGDFVDGQCLTTTTPSPETTTTTMVEDIGELIIICDADDEMAHCAIVSLIVIMRILIIVIKHSLC